jgi:hypothetical protein
MLPARDCGCSAKRLAAAAACFQLGVAEVGCLAHARRKVHKLWANHGSQVGEKALKFFASSTTSSAKWPTATPSTG